MIRRNGGSACFLAHLDSDLCFLDGGSSAASLVSFLFEPIPGRMDLEFAKIHLALKIIDFAVKQYAVFF